MEIEDKDIREVIDKSYDTGLTEGRKEMLRKTCKWLEKNISHYIVMEWNEFHHCSEYEGFDIDRLIKDLKKEFKNGK